jgi:hypothetical protein
MRLSSILLPVLTAIAAAGNGNNAPPVETDHVCFSGIEASEIALMRPDGTSWDPDGGAPDVVLMIESYASLEDYSSADTVRTAPVADVAGAAAWESLDPIDMHDDGALVIRVLDSDGGGFELMDILTIETADLADGANSFEGEGGTRLAFRMRRIDE